MNLYSFYTPSHRELVHDWFLSSLKDDYEINLEAHCQICPTARFKSAGWIRNMVQKANLILQAIEENLDAVFVYSDVDIYFYQPTKELILSQIKDYDVIFQRNSIDNRVCTGFFAAKGNAKNRALWNHVKQELESQDKHSDQALVNNYLLNKYNLNNFSKRCDFQARERYFNPAQLKWNYFPDEIFSPGIYQSKMWNPGDTINFPKNIILHHANWTMGVGNKLKQLKYGLDQLSG